MAVLSGYHQILVGIDGSKQARTAFEKACAVAKRNGATLVVASVLSISKLVGPGTAQLGFGSADPAALEEVKAKMERLVNDYRQKALDAGVVDVITHVSYGNPKTELARDLPTQFKTDLIVLGATGLNVVQRVVMGSNASYVVANATCDVMIIRTGLDNVTN